MKNYPACNVINFVMIIVIYSLWNFLEKVDFEKNQQTTKINKNYPACNVLNFVNYNRSILLKEFLEKVDFEKISRRRKITQHAMC